MRKKIIAVCVTGKYILTVVTMIWMRKNEIKTLQCAAYFFHLKMFFSSDKIIKRKKTFESYFMRTFQKHEVWIILCFTVYRTFKQINGNFEQTLLILFIDL